MPNPIRKFYFRYNGTSQTWEKIYFKTDWDAVLNKPTLSINNGTITIGSNSITPLTSVGSVNGQSSGLAPATPANDPVDGSVFVLGSNGASGSAYWFDGASKFAVAGHTHSDYLTSSVAANSYVSYSTEQALNETQMGRARNNIGAGTSNLTIGTSSSTAAAGNHDHDNTYLKTTLKGAASGLAELDANGKVPSSQLPSYVDDVLEYTSSSNFPATGETGKIYVATSTNLTYRWTGSTYVEISPSLALGETSSTAYRGDRGKTAYDHASQSGAALQVTVSEGLWKISMDKYGHVIDYNAIQKSDITGLGIPESNTWRTVQCKGTSIGNNTLNLKQGSNITLTASNGDITIAATDTTYESKSAANGGTAVSLVTTGEKYTWNNKLSTAVTKLGTRTGDIDIATLRSDLGLGSLAYSSATIPTNTNQLINGAGFLTSSDMSTAYLREFLDDQYAPYSHSHSYLPLSGGTLNKTDSDTPLYLQGNSGSTYLGFKNSSGTVLGYYYVNASNKPGFYYNGTGTEISLVGHTHSQYLTSHQDISGKADKASITAGWYRRVYVNSQGIVTNADQTDDNTTYNFSGTTFYSGNSDTAEHNANNATANGHYYYTSNGPSGLGESTTDGALYVQSYSSNWVGQIAQDYRNGRIWVRGKNNGTWSDWKRIAQYNELPTNTNQLTNGAGFITSSGSCAYATSAGSAASANTASTAATASALGVTEAVGGSTQPVYINSSGVPVACSYTIAKSVPSNADFTNTWRPLGTGASDACAGNDSRLSNSRTPTAHASSSTTYGVGTTSNYGHVKIVTGDLNGNLNADGYAAGANHTHSQYMTTSSAIERLQYTTTVPSSANASGLKIYIGSTNPSTKYSGWLYIITS